MKKYKDLETGKVYKIGDALVRENVDYSTPGIQMSHRTTVLLTEFSVNQLIQKGWLEVIEEKDSKTYMQYLQELQDIPDKEAVEMCPWMVVPVLMKLIKKDFNSPIGTEGWALSNVTLDFIPIKIRDVVNPELVTLFSKEDADKIRILIKPLLDGFKKQGK